MKDFKSLVWYFLIVILFIQAQLLMGQNSEKERKLAERQLDIDYTVTEATRQYLFGNLEQAKFLFGKCVEFDSTCAAANYMLSSLVLLDGNVGNAEKFAKRAYMQDPSNLYYLENYADVLVSAEKFKEASVLLEKLVLLKENEAGVLKYVRVLEKLGNNKEARKVLLKYQDLGNINLKGELIKVYENEGKVKKALALLEEIYGDDSTNIQVVNDLAVVYIQNKRYKDAELLYQKYCFSESWTDQLVYNALHFYLEKGKAGKADLLMKALYRSNTKKVNDLMALTARIASDEGLFKVYGKGIINFSEGYIVTDSTNDKWLLLLADMYNKTGQYNKAENILEKRWNMEETNGTVLNQLLYTYNLDGNPKLESTALKATALFPQSIGFQIMYGLGLMTNKNYEKALDTFKDIMNDNLTKEGRIQIMIFMGECNEKLGNYEEADMNFNEVLKLDPGNLVVLNNYSYYLAERNQNLEKALKMIEIVIRENRTNPTYLDTYAWILYKLGNKKKAIEWIGKAFQLDGGKDDTIKSHYGIINEK